MKQFKITLIYIGLLLAYSSCNYSGKLTKRYSKIEVTDIASKISDYVSVSAFINEKDKTDPPKPKTIFDLTERGQQELIKQLGINETANEKIISILTSSLSTKSSSAIDLLDYTVAEKRINITIDNLSHWPADRISKITVLLKIDSQFKITGCNRLTTEFQTIDLGKLNYSNSNSFELSGNTASGFTGENGLTNLSEQSESDKLDNLVTGVKNNSTNSNSNTVTNSKGINGKFNASRSFSEEVQLRQRIVTLNGSIENNNTLKLYQDGISGIDLKGNLLADIIFNSDNDIVADMVLSFSELTSGAGIFNEPANVKVKETIIKYFNYTSDITADLSFTADFRRVKGKRHKTTTESDDSIEILYGETTKSPKKVTLISRDKLIPKLWVLYDRRDTLMRPIQIFNPSVNGNGDLIFNSNLMVREFMLWLRQKTTAIVNSNGAIGSSGYALRKSDGSNIDSETISNLAIKLK